MKTELPAMTVGQCKRDVRSEIEYYIELNGWKMLHNGERRLAEIARLIAVKVVDNEGMGGVVKAESFVSDEEILHRMVAIGADINLDDTVRILNNQDAIPKEWCGRSFLTGVICEDNGGKRRILYFYWRSDCWSWSFFDFSHHFDARVLFVIPVTDRP